MSSAGASGYGGLHFLGGGWSRVEEGYRTTRKLDVGGRRRGEGQLRVGSFRLRETVGNRILTDLV